jgi:PhnB protein
MASVKSIPDGYHTVTPYIIVKGAGQFISFLEQGFGAKEKRRLTGLDEVVIHGEVQIGDSVIMLAEAMDEFKEMSTMIHLYVEDIDAAYKRVLEAGAVTLREPVDQFYGDRTAGVQDPFGNKWWISTHIEDISTEEMKKRFNEQMKEQKQN